MMRLDNGKSPNLTALRTWNYRKEELIIRDLVECGLRVKASPCAQGNLVTLKRRILRDGLAIVNSENRETGGHAVIVDSISTHFVLLREPYHGVQMHVTVVAFTAYYSGGRIIQYLR